MPEKDSDETRVHRTGDQSATAKPDSNRKRPHQDNEMAATSMEAVSLKKRKVSNEKQNEAETQPGGFGTKSNPSNPFAKAIDKLKSIGEGTKPTVFGAGFTNSSGFGSLSSTTVKGFEGSSTTFSSFDPNRSITTGLSSFNNDRSTVLNSGFDGFRAKIENGNGLGASPKESEAVTILPQNVKIVNGEEGEEIVLETRVKSYQLVSVASKHESKKTDSVSKGGVPPSSHTKAATDKNATREETESRDEGASGEEGKGNDDQSSQKEVVSQEWKERGKGPLRVLRKMDRARVVQRRENAPGGAGTALLVNVVLCKECKLLRPTEKSIQLITVGESGSAETHLFRVKTVGEATELQKTLKEEIELTKSCLG